MNNPSQQERAHALRKLFRERIVVIDGAMGTMIQKHKLSEADYRGQRFADWKQDLKGCNDLLVITRPEVIAGIHQEFIAAGADVISTNTFNATTIAMADYGMEELVPELNRTAARCLLEHYRDRYPNRRLESVWSHAQSFSAALLLNSNAVLDKIVYTLTNPVKDGLVRDYRRWPGFNTRPGDWRRGARVARRPNVYFKNTPEQLSYEVCAPSQLGDSVDQVACRRLDSHI